MMGWLLFGLVGESKCSEVGRWACASVKGSR